VTTRLVPSRRRGLLIALAAGALVLASACGYSATPVPTAAAPSTPPPDKSTCTTTKADLASYPPNIHAPGPTISRIKKAGVLRIGVSWDTYLMAARNAQSNGISGFDIDVARAIAKALGVRAELDVISAGERQTDLENGTLDMVVREYTITCDRWKHIAFSSEYYDAGQKVLVRKDLADKYAGPQDLAGLRVCAPVGTTSLANIEKVEPKAIAVTAQTHTGCLMKFQQGDADAITGDDTVLAGLVAQDPYAVVPPGQRPLEDEPYGVGMNKKAKDLVRFVNAVLQQYAHDGQWERSYRRWLEPALQVPAQPPTPDFSRR